MTATIIALDDQIKFMEELALTALGGRAMRLARGSTEAFEDSHAAKLAAVRATLIWLKDNEAPVRDYIRAKKAK